MVFDFFDIQLKCFLNYLQNNGNVSLFMCVIMYKVEDLVFELFHLEHLKYEVWS